MKIKDSTIICLLILTWVFIFCGVMGSEARMDELVKQLQELGEQQQDLSVEVTAELAEHEDRLYLIEHNQEITKIRISNHYEKFLMLQEQVAEHNDRIKKVEQTPKSSVHGNRYNLKVSAHDKKLMASLVYLECGSQSYRCQKAVASVVVNRMIRYRKTVRQAIYERGVFSVASKVARTTPNQSCVDAVNSVLKDGTTLPLRVTAFRNGHYHSFGKHYCKIDGVYFTYV